MNSTLWRTVASQARLGLPIPLALERIALRDAGAQRLAHKVRRGASLGEAAAREALPPTVVSAIAVAEQAGDLPRGLDEVADLLEKADERDASWRAALAYPQILAVALLGLAVIIGGSLKQIVDAQTVFISGLNLRVPSFIGWVHLVVDLVWTPQFAMACAALVATAHVVLSGRFGLEAVRMRLPLVGDWLVRLQLASWLAWLDWLTTRGVALPLAVRTASAACSSPSCRAVLGRVADRVDRGTPLSEAMTGESMIPGFALWLVDHAERAEFRNHLLARAAAVLERDARAAEQSFFPMVEHFAILVLGLGTASLVFTFFSSLNMFGGLY